MKAIHPKTSKPHGARQFGSTWEALFAAPTCLSRVEVLAIVPLGDSLKIIGRGLNTGLTHTPVLNPEQLAA